MITRPFVLAGMLTIASLAAAQAPSAATQSTTGSAPARPAPAPLQVPTPHYVSVPMSIEVNAPVDKVWARIGKYCDIGEWGIAGCTILSGDGSSIGTVRSIGNEIMVGKSKYSYTYTQPVREGVKYNLYHGTLEAEALTPTTTRLKYTLVFDNSLLADDAAREKDSTNRTARFTKMLNNAKTLAEGGALPAGALAGPPVPPSAAPTTR